ncbi:hypothetical protein ACQR1I_16685 [Bradyrhizobium sp. HKCCYLS2038]|uniref:hypothetical protein n=1 Tax=unclassified Bradyrhizobium TaxID=2631580 RepID=UPI003EBD3161
MNAVVTLETILEPAPVPAIIAATLFGTGQVETVLTAIETQVRGTLTDISTAAGREAVKSLAYKIARSKTILDDMGKEAVADIKAQSAKIDKERKTLRDRLDALKDEVRKPVTDYEDAERERINGHEAALVDIINAGRLAAGQPANLIRGVIETVNRYAGRDWQEFNERATAAISEAIALLAAALAAAEQRERDAAELEQLRQEKAKREAQQRAEEAARQAAELERQRAELAEKWKQDAEERARIAAQEAAARAVEAERLRVAREKAAQEVADRKRAENARRRNKVHSEILTALSNHLEPELAADLIKTIAAGGIPHVSITY